VNSESRAFRLLPLLLLAFLVLLGLGIEGVRFHRLLWLPKLPIAVLLLLGARAAR
jgi:hypothetical protein